MSEKEIERRLCELVRQYGGLAYKFVSPNNSGAPDRIFVLPGGKVWFVEVKTERGRLSKIQAFQIDRLESRSANVRVVKGEKGMAAFIREVFEDAYSGLQKSEQY
jgi:Holliday junction resolvase